MAIKSSSQRINDIIKEAIAKHQITPGEYETILSIADEDGHIDAMERAAISNLRDLIDDKTVRIVSKGD